MDDERYQPPDLLPLWPWMVMMAAVVGGALIAGPPMSGPGDAWGVEQPWGVVLLLLTSTVYGVGVFRSVRLFARLRSLANSENPVVGLFGIGLGLLMILSIWMAIVSVVSQIGSWPPQDHWPFLMIVVGSTAVLELAGRWQVLATGRMRFPLRELLLAAFLVAMASGAIRYLWIRHQEDQARSERDMAVIDEMSRLWLCLSFVPSPNGSLPQTGRPYAPGGFDINFVQDAYPEATQWPNELAAAGLKPEEMDAAEALVFRLGGPPDPADPKRPGGFGPDPAHPFAPGSPRTIRFEFDPDRLTDVDGDGWIEYQAPPRDGSTNPMVFRLQGHEVVVAEYDGRSAGSRPLRIYHFVNDRLQPAKP